ncbi:MAG: hypothetical protein JWM86_1749 [Thermoleophilia bacterium]|nr:hypothetical protein [Thermoleophilia bacterium]
MDSPLQTALLIATALASATWIVAVAWSAGRGAQVRSKGSAQDVVDYAGTDARISSRVAIPAALIALATGVWLVAAADLDIRSHWYVGTALGAWPVAFLGSTALRGAQLKQAHDIAAKQGAEDEDVRWRIRQVTLITRGELMLLLVAAAVVIIQPA